MSGITGIIRSFSRRAKMVIQHKVEGYDDWCKFMDALPSGNSTPADPHIFLFTGSKQENGVSWCPTCVVADPIVKAALETAPENAHFITVLVGDRPTWKDPNCPFRKDPRTKLMVIPTMIRWKGPQRLEGDHCTKPELVEMIFTEFDD